MKPLKHIFCSHLSEILVCLLVIILSPQLIAQNCYPAFNSQSDIDNFKVNYPGCLHIGSLELSDPSIVNLDSLDEVESIFDLEIDGTGLVDLNGLNNVDTIHQQLIIVNNQSMVNLSGLDNLKFIGAYTEIADNSLQSFVGIESLEYVGGVLELDENVINMQGFNGLKTIDKRFILSISTLESLDGLQNLMTVNEEFGIGLCPKLVNLEGLNNLTCVNENFQISSNDKLESLEGLDKLSKIDGGLSIQSNPKLTSLKGMDTALDISTFLEIDDNDVLKTLDGIENVQTVGLGIFIYGNAILDDITAMRAITSTASTSGAQNPLSLNGNPMLTFCTNKYICDNLSNTQMPNIFNNGGGCNSFADLQNACNSNDCYFIANDSNWDIDAEWSGGNIPDINCNVIIPNGNKCNVPLNYSGVCKTLDVKVGAELCCPVSATLEVLGN